MPKQNAQRTNELLASVTPDMLEEGRFKRNRDNNIQVEKLLLDLVRPHPVQPRRVMPEAIHLAFHEQRYTPTQAINELIQIVQIAARQRSHPFSNVLELLNQPDNETEGSPSLSPEEILLRDLVHLAVTIRDDGQVNPLTVVDVSVGASNLYRIETGERRYWATWLLRDFIPNSNSDGTIPCIIVPSNTASVFRQAKENTTRSGLTAIAMARQAALLLLAVNGKEIPDQAVGHDFYRQALDLDLRGKNDAKQAVLAAMGGIGLMQFSRYKSLLNLSDEAMELADRHAIDERKLRYVAAMPVDTHLEFVRQIIDRNLTSRQIEAMCADVEKSDDVEDTEQLSPKATKMARSFSSTAATTAYEVAFALLKQEQDTNRARERIAYMRQFITEIENELERITR